MAYSNSDWFHWATKRRAEKKCLPMTGDVKETLADSREAMKMSQEGTACMKPDV